MDKTKKKASRKPLLAPDQQLIASYLLCALLLPLVLAVLLWFLWIKPTNEQQFSDRLRQLTHQQEQAVSTYQQSLLNELQALANSESVNALANTSEDQLRLALYDLQKQVMATIPHSKTISLYLPGQAQKEKDNGGAIGFVELYMINRTELGETVYPEIARIPGENNWLIHWVVPVGADEKGKPRAILHMTTDTAGLREALSRYDMALAETQVIQHIERQRPITFITLGQGGYSNAVTNSIANSYWQVKLQPSQVLAKRSATMPWISMIVVLAVAVVALVVAWRLAINKNRQQAALYKVLDVDAVKTRIKKADNTDSEVDISNPIYLADEQMTISEEDEALIDGVHQQKQSHSQADSSGATTQSAPVSSSPSSEGMAVPAHIFRAYDIRGIVDQELTPAIALAIGKALATEALEQGEQAMLLGCDARGHSPILRDAVRQGIVSTGCDVIDMGLVPTPLLNFAAVFSERTSSGIVVTASHNAKQYNGFKMIVNERTLVDEDIRRLQERIENGVFVRNQSGDVIQEDFAQDYIDTIAADIAVNSGIRMVIDAANGAASELAPALFTELGCEVIPLFCEFDGEFPNHDPDPTVAANLQPLIEKVTTENADLGIALDGDGDRLVVVSGSGQILWPDQLLMLFARDVVSRNPGCDVIFDIKSTRQLNQVIAGYGGRPVMWKTGHSHIKAKMRETGALLAGEYSGHIFFKERWFGFDDGLYAAARLLEIMSLRDQSLDDILSALPVVIATPEIKLPVPEDKKFLLIEKLIAEGDFASGEKITIDGLRVDFAKGWGLVRPSNTAPVLTLRFEASNENGLEQLKTLFKRELKKIDNTLPLDF